MSNMYVGDVWGFRNNPGVNVKSLRVCPVVSRSSSEHLGGQLGCCPTPTVSAQAL